VERLKVHLTSTPSPTAAYPATAWRGTGLLLWLVLLLAIGLGIANMGLWLAWRPWRPSLGGGGLPCANRNRSV